MGLIAVPFLMVGPLLLAAALLLRRATGPAPADAAASARGHGAVAAALLLLTLLVVRWGLVPACSGAACLVVAGIALRDRSKARTGPRRTVRP